MTLKLNKGAMEFEGLADEPTETLRRTLWQAVELKADRMAKEIRAVLLTRESQRIAEEDICKALGVPPQYLK